MFTNKKIAIVSVINDLSTDARVEKTCTCLVDSNFEVIVIGRKVKNSLPLNNLPWTQKRITLLINKGPLFYLFFNLRLFFFLLFKKVDLLFANDLDTLLPNYLISKLKNIPLIYDSHELFCEVPELITNPTKKKIWLKLEKWIIPKLRNCITVNQSIANIFEAQYKTKFNVVRNIPEKIKLEKVLSKEELGLPLNKKIIILQGAGINIDRGAEELIEAMQYTEDTFLLIIGSGDVWDKLIDLVKKLKLESKVKLITKIPKKQLMHYTINADLGITLDKNTNKNYFNSLPNKVFDYLHAGLPIFSSPMPEIVSIINRHQVGFVCSSFEPRQIAEQLSNFINSAQYSICRANVKNASAEYNWETEKKNLLDVITNSVSQ